MWLRRTSWIGLFGILFLFGPLAKGNVRDKDYVLMINVSTDYEVWASYTIDSVRKCMTNEMGFYLENLNLVLQNNEDSLLERKNQILEKYTNAPACIVLLGASTWGIFENEFSGVWKDVPVVLCTQMDFIYPLHSYLQRDQVLPEEVRPLKLVMQGHNATVIESPVYIRETIEGMKKLLPGMERVVLISDHRYVSTQVRHEMKEVCRKYFPDLEVSYMTEGHIELDVLLDSIRSYDMDKVGLLYFSWLERGLLSTNRYLSANNHKTICNYDNHPVFVLDDVGIKEGEVAGGYFSRGNELGSKALEVVREILAGREAKDIPWQITKDPHYFLCYNVLQKAGIPESLYPRDAVYYFAPESFWSRNRYTLFVIAILALLIYMMWSRMRLLKKGRHQREKEVFLLKRYKSMFDNMPLAYVKHKLIYNAAGDAVDYEVVEANSMFDKYFCNGVGIVGRKGTELLKNNCKEYLILYKKTVTSHQSFTIEYYHRSTRKYYEVLIKDSVEMDMVDVFCVDLTDLRETKSMLESVNHKLTMALEVANIIPWRWDLKKKTVLCDVNRPIELKDFDNGEDHLSVPEEQYFAKIYKEDRDRVKAAYSALVEGKVSKVKEEYRVLDKSQHHYTYEWVEAQATVDSRDQNGVPLSLVGSSVVITNRKKMEFDLREAKEHAEESNRLKSAFLANMSHEIRTPLNAIVGFSNILAATDEEEEKKEYINIIENNNTLLLQLISDILDLSKIESGSMEFAYSEFDLNALLHELEQACRLKLTSDSVKLLFEEGMPLCYVRSERNRLTQLVANLINNAIKFTEKGSVRFGYYLLEKEFLYFFVTDTGCGIAADKKDSVFERFVKLNSFAQGTGLGLSICKMIVERMGGKIGVESELGKGTTFWFTIPYVPVKQLLRIDEEEAIVQQVVEKSKLKILVAEDNPSNYMLFESILKKDYHLIHAWNGREAVELFTKHEPHLVLMDINMPELNGFEAVQEIRKMSSTIPVIAVTAYAYASDEDKIMESGFDAYAAKPINAKVLRSKILTLLEKRLILL